MVSKESAIDETIPGPSITDSLSSDSQGVSEKNDQPPRSISLQHMRLDEKTNSVVSLKPQLGGTLWIGEVMIGGQRLMVDFDTGSSSVSRLK